MHPDRAEDAALFLGIAEPQEVWKAKRDRSKFRKYFKVKSEAHMHHQEEKNLFCIETLLLWADLY